MRFPVDEVLPDHRAQVILGGHVGLYLAHSASRLVQRFAAIILSSALQRSSCPVLCNDHLVTAFVVRAAGSIRVSTVPPSRPFFPSNPTPGGLRVLDGQLHGRAAASPPLLRVPNYTWGGSQCHVGAHATPPPRPGAQPDKGVEQAAATRAKHPSVTPRKRGRTNTPPFPCRCCI